MGNNRAQDIRLRRFTSSRYLTRLNAPPSEAERHRVENTIAIARLTLSVLAFVAVAIDSTEPRTYVRLVNTLLGAWMIHGVGILAYIRFHGVSDRAQKVIHALDILFPAVLTLFTHGPASPLFSFFAFTQITAAFRWGLHETMATSVAGIALLDIEAVLMTAVPNASALLPGGEFGLNRLIIRCAYLVAIGVLVGTLGENEKERRAERVVVTRVLRGARADLGLSATVYNTLVEYMRIFDAERSYIVTRELATGRTYLWNGPTRSHPNTSPYATEQAADASGPIDSWQETIFFQRTRDGAIAKEVAASACRQFSVPEFPALPFHTEPMDTLLSTRAELGSEWTAHLFLVNAQLGSNPEQELRFAEQLLRQAISAIYSVYLVRRLRSRAGAMERARVARELHDGAIQSLISAEMRLDVLRRKSEDATPQLSSEIGQVQELVRHEVLTLRELMQQMRPIDVSPQHLIDVMADTVDRFRRDTGLHARFVTDVQEDVALSPHSCYELIRVLQEALTNVRKHAKAQSVLVTFGHNSRDWRLTVADDGKGFDFEGVVVFDERQPSSRGPMVIRDRVLALGGRLSIESWQHQGSKLDIVVPQKGHALHG
ncbi:MAG TPA: histidine kinase [Clostridia bacterium]|nr:histidine kinase [Clostridia bacterium]